MKKDLKLLAEGRTAQVFEWQEDTVIKIFFDWFPEKFIDIEYERNKVIRNYNVPSPKLIERVEIDGKIGLVFERINGETLLKHVLRNKLEFNKYGKIMGELQAKIHTISVPEMPTVLDSLEFFIKESEKLTSGLKKKIVDYIDDLEKDTKLCHFDFHPDQIMLTDKGPMVIDWMNAASGPPSADVARTYLLFTASRFHKTDYNFTKLKSFKVNPLFTSYLKTYLKNNKDVTKNEIYSWLLPWAAARLFEGPEHEHSFARKMIEFLLDE